MFTVAMVTE